MFIVVLILIACRCVTINAVLGNVQLNFKHLVPQQLLIQMMCMASVALWICLLIIRRSDCKRENVLVCATIENSGNFSFSNNCTH